MKGRRRGLVPVLLLALLLTGCVGREVRDMFALPQPPENYRNLNKVIAEVLRATGGESIAPQSGSNTRTVQLQDMDGDGKQESAVAFIRVSGAEKPLRIYIFRLQEDDSYKEDTCIEGVGTGITSVAYENVGGSEDKEVVVSWQISATDHSLGVYSTDDAEGIELLWVDSYTRFHCSDLDGDGEKELTVITLQTGADNVTRADFYDYDGAAMALKSTASLSAGVNEIRGVRGGNLQGNVPAVFVTGAFPDSNDQVVDILACREGVLTNVTLKSDTLRSDETLRSYNAVTGFDVNSDAVMEVPMPVLTPKAPGAMDDFWMLRWRQFDLSGTPRQVCATFHNVTDGWYFQVPDAWVDKVSISRKDSSTADERGVIFSLWQGEDREAEPFMVIYKLTGTTRVSRASRAGRVQLYSDSSVIYAYELIEGGWDIGLSKEEIIDRFHLIRTEWSTES